MIVIVRVSLPANDSRVRCLVLVVSRAAITVFDKLHSKQSALPGGSGRPCFNHQFNKLQRGIGCRVIVEQKALWRCSNGLHGVSL